MSELAYHYSRSANVRKAVLYQRLAGAQAARRFAHGEAAAHLRSALEAISRSPTPRNRSREELDLLVMLGPVVMALSGMGAAEPRAVYQRARELCRILDDDSQLFAVLWGLFATFTMNMELKEGQKIADELTSVAEQARRRTETRSTSRPVEYSMAPRRVERRTFRDRTWDRAVQSSRTCRAGLALRRTRRGCLRSLLRRNSVVANGLPGLRPHDHERGHLTCTPTGAPGHFDLCLAQQRYALAVARRKRPSSGTA